LIERVSLSDLSPLTEVNPMALTPEDVRNKQFSTAKRKGYEMDEVDAFLDQVEVEIGAMARENAELKGRLSTAAPAPVASTPAPEAPQAPQAPAAPAPAQAAITDHNEQAVAMLALAQKMAEEHKYKARIEAEIMISDAKARIVDLERAGQADRSSLERRVEELRAFEREYRTRLRHYHEGALKELEHRGTDTTAPAPVQAFQPVQAAPPPSSPFLMPGDASPPQQA